MMRHVNVSLMVVFLALIDRGASAGGEQASVQPNVQRSAFDVVIASAKAGTPLDFAYALVEAGVSAGVVVDAASFHEPLLRGPYAARPMGSEPRVPEVDAEAAAKLFATARRDYDVSVDRDVVLLYPVERKTDRFFTQQLANVEVANVTVVDATAALLRAIDPSIPKLGGTVGSWLGRAGEAPPTPEMIRGPLVSLALNTPTAMDALNEVVRQAPGTVWVLVRYVDVEREGTHYNLAIRLSNQQFVRYPYPLSAR
jgi:hypothetical protein